jgi:hypothetical protein
MNTPTRPGAYEIPGWALVKLMRVLKTCHGCDLNEKLDEYGYCVVCNTEMALMVDEFNSNDEGGES